MTTTDDGAPTLFDAPAPAAPSTRPRGKHPPPSNQNPDGPAAAGQPPPDPPRWLMVGWRSAERLPHSPTPAERTTAFTNTPDGPCARCGTRHHRYGEGGQPLCPACRAPSTTEE